MATTRPLAVLVLHAALTGRATVEPLRVQPRSVEVALNDYKTADTWRATLALGAFPWDPRIVLSAGVDIYMGEAGADGQLALGVGTHMLSGFVDTLSSKASDSGVEVELEGRDFTSLLLDTTFTRSVTLGRLSVTLAAVVAQVPGASALTIRLDGIEDVDLSTSGRGRFSPAEGSDAWTVVTEIVRRVGAVAFVRGSEIVVAGPAVLFPRTAPTELRWGRDLVDLDMTTRSNANRRRGVKAIGRDPLTGEGTAAFYPPAASTRRVDTRGRQAPEVEHYTEWVVGEVPVSQLGIVAQRVWEAQARGTVEGRARTRRVRELTGGASLTRLRHSSPVRIVTPQDTLAALAGSSGPAAVGGLVGGPIRMDRATAERFVATARTLSAAEGTFYVQEATHRWSAEGGYELTLAFINYITLEAP